MMRGSLPLLFVLCTAAHGFTISPHYSNSPNWTPELQTVITQACSDWTSRLAFDADNTQDVPVSFRFANGGTSAGTYLAYWSFSVGAPLPSYPYDDTIMHIVTVNADFLPLSHVSLDAPVAGDGYDFLTVVEHELGHALGFANNVYFVNGQNPWSNLIQNNVFDPTGLAIPMNSDKSHVAVPADLMYFSLPPGTRKGVSAMDLQMLSLAYGYSAIPEPASLALLSCGALVLLRRPRRQRR